MKRVFVHNQTDEVRSTIALDVAPDFLEQVKRDIGSTTVSSIPIKIGTAFCHPVDSYNKAVGRAIASSRVDYVWFELDTMIFKDDRICLTLNGIGPNVSYFLRAHVYRDSGNVRVIEAIPEVLEP